MQDGQLFTWMSLATISGASLLTFFFVMYTKELIARFAPNFPTGLYAVVVAFVILTLAQLATGANGTDWRIYPLAFANAFLVAAAAGHMNDKALNPPGSNKPQNPLSGPVPAASINQVQPDVQPPVPVTAQGEVQNDQGH
jgi:hypothetical protein